MHIPRRKTLLYVSLAAVGLFLISIIGFSSWLPWERHLPSEQTARKEFQSHQADYIRFAVLLRQESGYEFIGGDGGVRMNSDHVRVVPAYRDLISRIGAKNVIVREDGSIEFTLWGSGCAICSDSYMGIRYSPMQNISRRCPGWTPIPVNSLDSKALPRENGHIADGLYVVQLEPEWFIYRFEYR